MSHCDIEIKDYVILPHGEDDRLPPRTLVMDVRALAKTVFAQDQRMRTFDKINLGKSPPPFSYVP